MRLLVLLALTVVSVSSFARDSYEEEVLTAISADHVPTTSLVIQINRAIILGHDSVPMADLEENSLGGNSHNNMVVPLRLLFDEMKHRSEMRSTISYRNQDGSINWRARNRYKQVPFQSIEVSRALIQHVLSFKGQEEQMFNADPKSSGEIMGAALDFIAYTALRGSDPFRKFVGEFIIRGQGSLVFRTKLLEYMLDDAMADLNQFRPNIMKPSNTRWLHSVASQFGRIEYERVMMDTELSRVLDTHQRMLAFANAKGMKICDLWLDTASN